MAHEPGLLVELDALIARAKDKLSKNPDYIMLRALERARAEAMTGQIEAGKAAIAEAFEAPNVVRVYAPKASTHPSQIDAATSVLQQAAEPLPIHEMVERVRAMGGIVGGKNPNINLGSTLSRSEQFVSVRWKGQHMWWFRDQPLPKQVSLLGAAE